MEGPAVAFPLDIRTDLNLGGTWTNVSPDVYVRDAKRITRGLRDQGSAADPASLTLTFNNRSGKYSHKNATSPLFGLIGRNTPIRLSVPGPTSYLQLDGRDGNFASTPDTAALDITGDMDVRVEMEGNWFDPQNQWVIGKWAPGQQSWAIFINLGSVQFRRTTDGTDLSTGRVYATRTTGPAPAWSRSTGRPPWTPPRGP
jgi:hypothetical protein